MSAEQSASRALDAAFAPRGIAVVGASDRLWSYGRRPIENLQRHGFAGQIVPVNPKYETVCGLPCIADVSALSDDIDLAIVLTRGDRLPQLLDELGRTGVRVALVFASSPSGPVKDEVRAAVARSGVRVIGFSAAGLVSARAALMGGAFSAAWAGGLVDGPTAVVSQSGGIAAACLNLALDRGHGLRWLLSLGTAIDLDLADAVRWARERGDLAGLGLYIEGSDDGERLLRELTLLSESGTSIVAMKAGTSENGSAAATTHTGVIAGDDRVWDEALRAAGVLRTREVDDMCSLLEGLGRRGRRARSAGEGVLALSVGSGGGAALLADCLEAAGVSLLALEDAEHAALAERSPDGTATNPLDIAGIKGLPDEEVGALERILEWAADCPRVGQVLICLPTMGFEEPAARIIGASRLALEGRVSVVWMAGSLGDPGRTALRRLQVPSFERFDLAASFVAMTSAPARRAAAPPVPVIADLLDDGAARGLLAGAGVRFPARTVIAVADLDRLAAPLDGVAAPWALKVEAPGLAHKAAVGGVVLGRHPGDATVQRAHEALRNVRAAGLDATEVVAEEMVDSSAELIVSLRRDPTFGPVTVIGVGGSLVEAVGAVALHVGVPGVEAVAAMLERSGAAAVLAAASFDREAVASELATIVAAVAAVLQEGVESVELNPVVPVHRDGGPLGVVALDAVVRHA